MLAVFLEWFRVHRSTLEAEGIALQFQSETVEQTIKANQLSLTYGRYEGCIYVWERGDGNIELVDMEANSSAPLEECSSFVEVQFNSPYDLDMALSSFFRMLVDLPDQRISVQAAMLRYWQSLPVAIRQ